MNRSIKKSDLTNEGHNVGVSLMSQIMYQISFKLLLVTWKSDVIMKTYHSIIDRFIQCSRCIDYSFINYFYSIIFVYMKININYTNYKWNCGFTENIFKYQFLYSSNSWKMNKIILSCYAYTYLLHIAC